MSAFSFLLNLLWILFGGLWMAADCVILLMGAASIGAAHAQGGFKEVVDSGIAQGVDWRRYRVKLILAGEVFSEVWRGLVGERLGADGICHQSSSLYGTALAMSEGSIRLRHAKRAGNAAGGHR